MGRRASRVGAPTGCLTRIRGSSSGWAVLGSGLKQLGICCKLRRMLSLQGAAASTTSRRSGAVENPRRYDYTKQEELRLDPLPCWTHLPRERRRRVRELVRDIEREAAAERQETDMQSRGAEAVTDAGPIFAPRSSRGRGRRSSMRYASVFAGRCGKHTPGPSAGDQQQSAVGAWAVTNEECAARSGETSPFARSNTIVPAQVSPDSRPKENHPLRWDASPD